MKLFEIFKLTSRQSFNETWLKEMPSGLGQFETLDTLEYSIKDFIKHGVEPEQINHNLFKIEVATTVLYWYGTKNANEIQLAVKLKKESEALVVTMLGKNKKLKSKPPYASDLYIEILKHSDENIRIMSDKFLSDEGLTVWQTLVSRGHSVSVYDSDNPGKSFKTFDSVEELNAFFANDDTDFASYQYVLSEGVTNLMAVRSSFNLRKHRESVNGLL